MGQNIYDDDAFFREYSRLPRSLDGLEGAPEWPALRAMLPDLQERTIVDLGCGFGWFCRWAREGGAAHVTGIDVSEKMLQRARAETHDAAITYEKMDLELIELPKWEFDLAYSSLAFHYVEDFRRLMHQVHRSLVPGGRLVFSVEHPIFTAPSEPKFVDVAGRATWPVDRYLDEGPRTTNWLAPNVIKQHRTMATYLNVLADSGFGILRLDEWGPSAEQIAVHPDWRDEQQRPPFLLVNAKKA